MGESQLRGVDNLAAEVDEIDVNRPGPVSHGTDPSKDILDGMHSPGKVENVKFCLKNSHLIEELERGEFGWHIDRIRLNDGACLHECRFRQSRKRGNRPFQVFCPRFQVRSEGNDGPLTWPLGVLR